MRTADAVLVVAAHPDDELLGAGATLAGHVAEGRPVHALVISEGASSRDANGLADRLSSSARRAADVMGFASIRLLGLPDQRLDALPLIELTQVIEELVAEVDPEIVYTHFEGDVNADHGVAARATLTACRPYRFPALRRLAAFETPSSTEWGTAAFLPHLFVDASDTLDLKLEAMACYESELREAPHPRSLRALRQRAATWGSCVGLPYAEPFRILREVVR
jgi:LmbE family N-acetylglucosaminyl deacetylase